MDVPTERVVPIAIEDDLKTSFINYSMSVIVSRALPDVRDGLKPVHRRILFTMHELGVRYNRSYKKCARVVGDCMGKYHPHGDSAIYDALVRMAQPWSLRYPLVDGQGNFGSVDGDSAAAMRYTEARMTRITDEMLSDIEKDTVDRVDNYDGSEREPSVLPSSIPNLLVNGSYGIAVGMATSCPPHNMREVCDALVHLIDNPLATAHDLMRFVKGPDFPTGGIIYGAGGLRDAYETGRGKVRVRAKAAVEHDKRSGKDRIIVTELPYQVNKARLIESIADMVRAKELEGITDLRDESDRDGMRIVIEIRKGDEAKVILNQLYKHTQMEDTFSIHMLALVNNAPRVLNLQEMSGYYIEHRVEIIRRRTEHDLREAEARAHILEGLLKAIDHIDEVIRIIRASANVDEARAGLIERFSFSEVQANAILAMRLRRLTGLDRDELETEYKDLVLKIEKYHFILSSRENILAEVRREILEVRDRFGDDRRTDILYTTDDFRVEDLIADEPMVVTISNAGYIKRVPSNTYRKQRRGGRGVAGMGTKEEDFVRDIINASAHQYMLFFTNRGQVYWRRVYELPQGSRTSGGRFMRNVLELQGEESVTACLPIGDLKEEGKFILMVTRKGVVKKTPLVDFSHPRAAGIRAIELDENDHLMDIQITNGTENILIATHLGLAIRFPETDVRAMGRTAHGVKGIELSEGDWVIGTSVAPDHTTVLSVTENGFGKRTEVGEYRLQHRGGKGLINIKTSERNGDVVGMVTVTDAHDIVLVTSDGVVIRTAVKDLRVIGRNTQGVTIMKPGEDAKVSAIARTCHEERTEEDDIEDDAEEENAADPDILADDAAGVDEGDQA